MFILDIEVYSDAEVKHTSITTYPYKKYLVHGVDDILWTDNIGEAMGFFTTQLLTELFKEPE